MTTKTVTITLDQQETVLLNTLAEKYATLATPSSIVHAAARAGLLRLAATLGLPLKGWKDDELKTALGNAPARGMAKTATVKGKL